MGLAAPDTPLKMYILVRDSIPTGFAMNSVAHASLACYLKFKNNPEMIDWVGGSFRKVTCKVNDAEFEKAKKEPHTLVITESALDGQEVAIAFCPRHDWPNVVKFAKKYN